MPFLQDDCRRCLSPQNNAVDVYPIKWLWKIFFLWDDYRKCLSHQMTSGSVLSAVCPDNIPDGSPTERTLSSCRPLLCCTLVAHAHVATGVEDTVYITLVTDHTLSLDMGLVKMTGRWLARARLGIRGWVSVGFGTAGSLTREWLSWIDANQLQLLSNSKDIKEGSGRDGDVSIEQDLVMSSIDRAGDLTIQAKGEA